MSTIHDDARTQGRPMLAKPTWELQNMVKALKSMPWLNTGADNLRLQEAERELKRRGKSV